MKKILVVDDSSIQRQMIVEIIQRAGFLNEMIEAEDGSKAIEMITANFGDIVLVLCDRNMPNMSGLEFVSAMAKIPQALNIPIIMVSVEGSAEKIAEAMALSPNLVGFITIPFTGDAFIAAIKPILTNAG